MTMRTVVKTRFSTRALIIVQNAKQLNDETISLIEKADHLETR